MTVGLGESEGSLCRVAQFRTTDLDEAREVLERHYYPVRIDPVGTVDRLAMSFHAVQIGPVTIGALGFNEDLRIRSRELLDAYQITIPVTGTVVSVHRDIAVVAEPGRAVVFQPDGDAQVDPLPSACRLVTVKIQRAALENQLAAALDRPIVGPVALAPSMDVSSGPGRSWARLASLIAADLMAPGGLTAAPIVADRLIESLVGGLLVVADHPDREELTRPELAWRPRPLRRAVDAMRANPAHPFEVAELATLAGVSVRALQAIFHRHTGMSPTAYLRELRLARVHEDLRRAAPGETTVAAVVHRWGFGHLGRAAAAYRDRYGVSPSTTLRSP